MYEWDGMKKISHEEARKLFGNVEVFLLYSDDTEGLAESLEQIDQHIGEFGVEKKNV